MQHIDEQHNIKRNDICSYYGWAICTQLLGLYADIQGNIYPCVAQNTKLGNIREGASFQEIRDSSPYMESIRQTFTGWCPYKTIPYHK
jgi:MoaA/NifB/PqqE/SkfB family radical SAM enzyme